MDSTRTLQQPQTSNLPRTLTGLAFLDEELLSAERGEEPNLDRVLRALEILRDDARAHAIEGVEALCCSLRAFVAELREDRLELSLEDLDVFLVTSRRIREFALASDVTCDAPEDPARGSAAPGGERAELAFAPEFRASGLVVETGPCEVLLRLPHLNGRLETARVVADLESLWRRAPAELPWRLDLSALERIPVVILATLNKLRLAAGPQARELRLAGELGELQSEELAESLARDFRLS